MRYLNELEKDRSPLVNRVFKFEAKNIACESRRMVIQLGRRCLTVSTLSERLLTEPLGYSEYDIRNMGQESTSWPLYLEKERTELVDFLLQIFERDDHSMGLKFLQMVEDNKYDLVMKFCRENVFGTTEGNPTEGSTVSLWI